MYSEWDIQVREIGGGIWFWMSLALTIAFAAYVVRKTLWERDRPDTVIFTAIGLSVFCLGSAMRGFLTWMQFFFAENGWDVSRWVETWPWLGMSVLLNILGAAACIWLLSPYRWRWPVTLGATAFAITAPFALFYLI